jgi:hypothetical protein
VHDGDERSNGLGIKSIHQWNVAYGDDNTGTDEVINEPKGIRMNDGRRNRPGGLLLLPLRVV